MIKFLALNSWTKIGEPLFILTFVFLSKSNNDSKESYFSILMEFLKKDMEAFDLRFLSREIQSQVD